MSWYIVTMTTQEIFDTVHEVDRLETEEIEAQQASALRRGKIAALRAKISSLTTTDYSAKTNAPQDPLLAVVSKRRESPRQDAIRRLVMSKPDANYRDIVKTLYGDVTGASLLNARSLVSNMKKAGMLAGDPGAWRVTGNLTGMDDAPAVPLSPFARAERGDDEDAA